MRYWHFLGNGGGWSKVEHMFEIKLFHATILFKTSFMYFRISWWVGWWWWWW